MQKLPALLLLLLPLISFSQLKEVDTIFSAQVKDNFIITILKPDGFDPANTYHHVYMTDGSIGIGDYVSGKNESWKAGIPGNCIVIMIAHTGNWHEKRRRDFIPTDITKNVSADFGKADLFYLFIKTELIPRIEKKFNNKRSRSFIGHSFGGLFCLYTLFKEDKLFDNHFAISPSCWANYYELEKIEEAYRKNHRSLKARLTIYVGGLEFLNKVLTCSRNFYTNMAERKYGGFSMKKEEIGNANHFSIRKPAIDRIFESLKNL